MYQVHTKGGGISRDEQMPENGGILEKGKCIDLIL